MDSLQDTAASLIADRYELVRPIGRGSFAQTLLAFDRQERRHVALKVLHPRRAIDWKSFDLFEREAAVLRGLDHPGIPAVYDVFRAPWEGSEAAFIAMEYIEGESLAEHIVAQRPLAPELVNRLLGEMLGVLEYLHTRVPTILHRDIKPANIILRPSGTPVLVDFGSVRNILLGADEDGSTIVGTYGYMPFEQLMGRASPASDLYALGATFLHLVAGRPPSHFLADDGGHLAVPESLPGGPVFRATIARMLRAAPVERFASARDARHALLHESVPPMTRAGDLEMTGPRAPAQWLLLASPTMRNAKLIDKLVAERAPTAGQLMIELVAQRGPAAIMFWIALAGVVSAGVVPVVIWMMARARRQQLRHYFTHGTLATARIERIDHASGMVHYAFDGDGVVCRGMDTIDSDVASEWEVGMLIQVLHIASGDGLSIVASFR
ncbi:MAG TPA: serine/threonine-protein kinase [Gemmatimonadaceae bacterium]